MASRDQFPASHAMADLQPQYDDAMFDYSTSDYDAATAKLLGILEIEPDHFDARLALAMCHYRKGDFARAIEEGHRAEKLRPHEQLVHTNLSLFYMKSGDRTTAEKHGLQARIASWKENMAAPPAGTAPAGDPELQMAQPPPKSFKLPEKFPEMPWKKSPRAVPPPPANPGPGSAPSPTLPPRP
ncbi:MAG: tetratricopeptide repeat protein [Verrucomicrobiota bacterium]